MNLKKLWDKYSLTLSLILFGGSLFSLNYKEEIALSIDSFLHPLKDHVPVIVILVFLSTASSIIITLCTKYMVDHKEMQRKRERDTLLQKEYLEAQRSQDPIAIKKITEKRKAILLQSSSSTMDALKPSGFISVVTLPLFYWISCCLIPGVYVNLPFGASSVSLSDPFFIFTYWLALYTLFIMVMSQFFRKILGVGGM